MESAPQKKADGLPQTFNATHHPKEIRDNPSTHAGQEEKAPPKINRRHVAPRVSLRLTA
jgi:hypothetical protein